MRIALVIPSLAAGDRVEMQARFDPRGHEKLGRSAAGLTGFSMRDSPFALPEIT
jgi:hypothetical protein